MYSVVYNVLIFLFYVSPLNTCLTYLDLFCLKQTLVHYDHYIA